jgi:hypothetical protein
MKNIRYVKIENTSNIKYNLTDLGYGNVEYSSDTGLKPVNYWKLDSNLAQTNGSISGSITYAGTNRTRFNPTTSYIESVGANVGRFEKVGDLNSLLIEPASTNHFLNSPGFGDWTPTRATVSTNATTAPDGTNTASKLVVDGTAANDHSIYQDIAHTAWTNGADVTYSFYAKAAEHSWMFLNIATKVPAYPLIYFNLSTGAVGTETVDSYGSEDVGNGWWRFWLTHDIGTGVGNTRWTIYPAEGNGDVTINGDSTSGIYLWGPQVEEQPRPTSLIYTAGAAVTRTTESGLNAFTLPTGLFDDKGTMTVWFRPGYAEASAIADGGIVSVRDNASSILYTDISGNGVASHDGTTEATKALAYAKNTWYKLIVKWGYLVSATKKFRVGIDSGSGVSWGTEQTFDGTFTLGSDLLLGKTLSGRMHLKDLSLFTKILTDTEINTWTGSP